MSEDCTDPIIRLSRQALLALIGQPEVDHLAVKGRGGANGFKGARFEQFFCTHTIARLARGFVERGEDAVVEWQSDGFVDDVVIRKDGLRAFKAYQLKNAQQVSWTAGKRSIEHDFLVQHTICTAEGYKDVKLRLVCSDQGTVDARKSDVPTSISTYAKPVYFPYLSKVEEAIFGPHTHPWLTEDFAYLSRTVAPAKIQVSEVAGIVMGAWDLLGPTASVSGVVAKARQMSPTLIRSLRSDEEAQLLLTREFCEILNAFPDFSYCIVRGFLNWVAFGGTTSGILSFDCFHPKFPGWQKAIVDMKPSAFDEVEGVFT